MIEEVTETGNKLEKDNFIGKTFNSGRLEVVGIIGKTKSYNLIYKVTCTECSKDPELFPEGYFASTKGNLLSGKIPCGCSKSPKWESFQFLILANRAAKGRFIVHGFSEEFNNVHTKLSLECIKDGHIWNASIDSVTISGAGCPKCKAAKIATSRTVPKHIALQKCIDICEEMNYEVVGFVGEYKGARKTRFEYVCPQHGKQNVNYDNFVNIGNRCPCCSNNGYDTSKRGSIYVVKWTRDTCGSFIKFGITNKKIESRIKQQTTNTLYTPSLVWSAGFTDGRIPKILEDAIKSSGIETRVILKSEFPDGFTETTYVENLDKIESVIINKLLVIYK